MSVPRQMENAVFQARTAGVLAVASFASGNLIARAHDEEQLRVYEPRAVPAFLAGAIARTANGRRDLPWRYLLDAMEDLAEVWPWTMVEP